MTLSKKKILVIFFIGFLMTFTIPSKGGNPFADETTTADGWPTWDSDMVNIEEVSQTGQTVYIAVLDTGLSPNWEDYFPEERIATEYGIGFQEALRWDREENDFEETTGIVHTTTFLGSRGACHGTHVTSTIIGYFYGTRVDESFGYDIPPIMVRGIAPNVEIIPVKVLTDFQIPGYEDDEGNHKYVHQTTYGMSERILGGIVGLHGDDHGIALPSSVAPIQVVIIPILFREKERLVRESCIETKQTLAKQGLRVHIDNRDKTPGSKFYDWELKGVPLRVDIGPRDIEKKMVTVVRRDGKKIEVKEDTIIDAIKREMDDYSETLMTQAQTFSENMIHRSDVPAKGMEGIIEVPWCGNETCGLEMEEELDMKTLGTPIPTEECTKKCPRCGKKATTWVRLAHTY